jgi:DNA-directed RNA polymerase subunit omega
MATRPDTMMNPSIEDLLGRAGSKFSLVTLSSMRARQINAYFNQLGEGLGAIVPPQVTSVARKPLSIAFEEIAGDKILPVAIAAAAGEGEGSSATEGDGAPGADSPASS